MEFTSISQVVSGTAAWAAVPDQESLLASEIVTDTPSEPWNRKAAVSVEKVPWDEK